MMDEGCGGILTLTTDCDHHCGRIWTDCDHQPSTKTDFLIRCCYCYCHVFKHDFSLDNVSVKDFEVLKYHVPVISKRPEVQSVEILLSHQGWFAFGSFWSVGTMLMVFDQQGE